MSEQPSRPERAPAAYRWGEHNARNIYRTGMNRATDEHVAVAFTPEMAKTIVEALNYHEWLRSVYARGKW